MANQPWELMVLLTPKQHSVCSNTFPCHASIFTPIYTRWPADTPTTNSLYIQANDRLETRSYVFMYISVSCLRWMCLHCVHWPFQANRTTLLQVVPLQRLCWTCVCGAPYCNNPSEQCREVSGFGAHALFVAGYFRSAAAAEAVMLSL